MKTLGTGLTQTRAGKALCALAFTLACFMGASAIGGMILASKSECYRPAVASYYDTDNCAYQVQRMANQLMRAYAADGLQASAEIYEADQTNLRFRISLVDEDGSEQQLVRANYDDDQETQYGVRYYFVCTKDGAYTSRIVANRDSLLEGWAPGGSPLPEELLAEAAALGSALADAEARLGEQAEATPAGGEETATGSARIAGVYLLEADLADPITVPSSYSGGLKFQYDLFNAVYPLRYAFIWMIGVGAALALANLILLLCGAGRLAGREGVVFCWFDRIPMELSLCGILAGVVVVLYVGAQFGITRIGAFFFAYDAVSIYSYGGGSVALGVAGIIGVLAAACTAFVLGVLAWVLAFARAAKSGHAFRNFWSIRFLAWLAGVVRCMRLAPKTALIVACFVAVNGLGLAMCFGRVDFLWFEPVDYLLILPVLWCVAGAVVLYYAAGMQRLFEAARRIAAGDYTRPVALRGLAGPLCEHAGTLQNIAAGLNTAVEQRIKSERMKTELITNVSHDLKTPLTSIINYTDLLQSQPLPEKAAEYTAVLARQSARLKKLTEDLIEASKASSGAMSCTLAPASLAELCEQALGEYAPRLEQADLTPVLTMPEDGLWANVDGRLVWRVLDNLLGNACKYAQPGTRLYVAGEVRGHEAVVAVKNISREPLNISADELMERFVRGDTSRTSEGSGLGLSIARSLCELQNGRFHLSVDGDLFKAELAFAVCPAPEQQ